MEDFLTLRTISKKGLNVSDEKNKQTFIRPTDATTLPHIIHIHNREPPIPRLPLHFIDPTLPAPAIIAPMSQMPKQLLDLSALDRDASRSGRRGRLDEGAHGEVGAVGGADDLVVVEVEPVVVEQVGLREPVVGDVEGPFAAGAHEVFEVDFEVGGVDALGGLLVAESAPEGGVEGQSSR